MGTESQLAEIGSDLPRARPQQRAMITAAAVISRRRDRGLPFARPERIERRQRARLRRIVAHAYEGVPYYRETMGRLGLTPADIASAGDIPKLPVIERDQLQRDPEYFSFENRTDSLCVTTRSGGSTSAPVTVLHDLRDVAARMIAMTRIAPAVARLSGKPSRLRVVSVHPPMSSADLLRGAHDQNRIGPPRLRLVERDLFMRQSTADNLAAINEFQPHVISAPGSYLEELFAYASRTERSFHRPAVVAYGGDSLSAGARRMLTSELGIEVLSMYQAVESPPIGFECERHRGHHLNIDLCPLRIVDGNERELPPGERGEVVLSNLVNRTTVLLNYRIGDLAARLPEPCVCGRTLPLLSLIEGRAADWLLAADGRRLHGQLLIRPFSLDQEIWGYRIEQRARGRFEAKLVPASGADPRAIATRVRERFNSIVGTDETVEISFVESLPRTGAGKVRRVHSGPR